MLYFCFVFLLVLETGKSSSNFDGYTSECWHGGILNETTQWCECPRTFKNRDIAPGKCQKRHCVDGIGPDSNNMCDCEGTGFTGDMCDVCTNDTVCQDLLDPYNKTGRKHETIYSHKNLVMYCDVRPDDDMMLMVLGEKATFQWKNVGFGANGRGEGYVQGWARNESGYWGETMHCRLKSCKAVLTSDRRIIYDCGGLECECGNMIPGLHDTRCADDGAVASIVDGMRGTFKFDCGSDGICLFLYESLDGDFQLTCKGRECQYGSSSPLFPEKSNSYLLLGFIGFFCSLLFIFLLLVCCICIIDIFLIKRTSKEYKKLVLYEVCGGKLEFKNLNYFVKVWKDPSQKSVGKNRLGLRLPHVSLFRAKTRILRNLSYTILPGRLVAVMGATGAGKTTLLDILGHRRKSGICTGQLFFNDKPLPYGDSFHEGNGNSINRFFSKNRVGSVLSDSTSYTRLSGYVLQEDVFMSTLTVSECLMFSADTRLPVTTKRAEKKQLVEMVMKKLRIYHIRNRRVGDHMTRGISGGERKRLSIALELVANPHVLLLDEPTSGLDSSTAFLIVKLLRRLSKRDGRTVVCSIHQPSENMFGLFDDLVLLTKGICAYAGAREGVLGYFESEYGATPPVGKGSRVNPADWLMDQISNGSGVCKQIEERAEAAEAEKKGSKKGQGQMLPLQSEKEEELKVVEVDRDDDSMEEEVESEGSEDESSTSESEEEEEEEDEMEESSSEEESEISDKLSEDMTTTAEETESDVGEVKKEGGGGEFLLKGYVDGKNSTIELTEEAIVLNGDSEISYPCILNFTKIPKSDKGNNNTARAVDKGSKKGEGGSRYECVWVRFGEEKKDGGARRYEEEFQVLEFENESEEELFERELMKFLRKKKNREDDNDDVAACSDDFWDETILEKIVVERKSREEEKVFRISSVDDKIVFVEDGTAQVVWNWNDGKLLSYATPFYSQLLSLSKRYFLHFVRNLYLLPAHVGSAVGLGVLLGLIFWQTDVNIAGCQNRMGVIFFQMCVLAFTALSGIEIFIRERPLYVRERANGYYYPICYYFVKCAYDIIPLRVVPAVLMGSIAYPMIDLRPGFEYFVIFIGILVLFNIIAGGLCICIGSIAPTAGSGNICASLIILNSMMFSGNLLNRDALPGWIGWLRYFSFWNYAYECLILNEFVDREILLDPSGMKGFKVKGQFLLNEMGFDEKNFIPNLVMLGVFCAFYYILSFVFLQFFVKEKR